MSSVGIVGGGVLGMAMAARLVESGHRVHLLEAAPATGGLASPEAIGEYTWDRFYHVILLSDSHLMEWLDRLGLRGELSWGQTKTGFWVDDRLVSLSTSWDYLRFPPLNLVDKIRLAATIIYASRITRPEPLERITALEWLKRWSGPRVVERLWRPLLQSKLGPLTDRASAAFIWAIIARLYAARRSGFKREQFGYVRGGYARILEQFRGLLDDLGVYTESGTAVTTVRENESGADVILENGTRHLFDHVVLTVPCPSVVQLCPQLEQAERERLGRVEYQGVICPSVLLRRPLAGYYVTNLTDPTLPFTGVIEMTALVDRDTFGGHSLVYLPRYVTQDDPLWQQGDDTVLATFIDGLRRLHPDLTDEDIVAHRVGRVRHVLAVSTLDYSATTKPPVATSLQRVHVVNSAQIAYGTLNVNETLGLVEAQLPVLHQRMAIADGAPATVAR